LVSDDEVLTPCTASRQPVQQVTQGHEPSSGHTEALAEWALELQFKVQGFVRTQEFGVTARLEVGPVDGIGGNGLPVPVKDGDDRGFWHRWFSSLVGDFPLGGRKVVGLNDQPPSGLNPMVNGKPCATTSLISGQALVALHCEQQGHMAALPHGQVIGHAVSRPVEPIKDGKRHQASAPSSCCLMVSNRPASSSRAMLNAVTGSKLPSVS
jgi:hypothetical protein